MVLVVTGGIGSGKSEVCRIIEGSYGLSLYNADHKVKEIYARYPAVVDGLERQLECNLRDEAGIFRPALLADRIFGDGDAVGTVERTVFPYLMEDFDEFLRTSDSPVVFESATVLEKEAFRGFGDVVVLVDAPVAVRLERACARDSSDRDRIWARMERQRLMNCISDGNAGEFEEYADILDRIDYKIMNTGTIRELEIDVKYVMDQILINIE